MAHAGAASRRASEKLILDGRVTVNGVTVSSLGSKVSPGDEVRLDGTVLKPEEQKVYLALNKPPEYLCSASDPEGRPLAKDLLPPGLGRLYNIGRLDYRSCGLILFTNDGDFAYTVGRPGSGLEKEYLIEAAGPVPDECINAFTAGIEVEGVYYRARSVERCGRNRIRIVLIEGKNREIRRVFSHFHLHPLLLRRVRIGTLRLGDLPEGQTRELSAEEIGKLGG
jgi:23S rRNA pseudouridine2605 synthase